MAYSIKQRRAKLDFRRDFPQLCPATTIVPLDYSGIKDIVEPVLPPPPPGLPHGWVNLNDPSTYIHPSLATHELMRAAVGRMKLRWIEYDRRNDDYIDYDNYDDGLDYREEETDDEDSLSAEDPDEYLSE
jgi:hypothetical protein